MAAFGNILTAFSSLAKAAAPVEAPKAAALVEAPKAAAPVEADVNSIRCAIAPAAQRLADQEVLAAFGSWHAKAVAFDQEVLAPVEAPKAVAPVEAESEVTAAQGEATVNHAAAAAAAETAAAEAAEATLEREEASSGSTKRVVTEVNGTMTLLESYEAHFLPIKEGVENGNYKDEVASHLDSLMIALETYEFDKVLLDGFRFAALEEPSKRAAFAERLVNDLGEQICSLGAKKSRTGGA